MSNTIEIGLRVVVQNHMPFTAGTYVFKQLRTVGTVTRNSPMHDLPVSEWRYATEFMTIRPIPDWYRSAHGYMSPNWRCGGTDSHLWNMVNARLVHCKDDDFEKFMDNVIKTYPGLCSWVYSMYAVPNIQLVHIDDIDDYLLAEFGIEPGEPDNSHKKEGVEITPRLRARLKLTEDPVWWMLTRS